MKNYLKIISVFILVVVMLITSSCNDKKSGRPWGISDETITDIVKARLGCDEMKVIVGNVGTPQIICDQLGNCDDYADTELTMEGVCKGRRIKGSGVFRIHRSKLGNFSGEIVGSME